VSHLVQPLVVCITGFNLGLRKKNIDMWEMGAFLPKSFKSTVQPQMVPLAHHGPSSAFTLSGNSIVEKIQVAQLATG